MFDNIKKVVLCAASVLLVGCGKQHKAEGVIKDFLNENLVTQDYTVSFSNIDSTKHVSDSAMTAMRTAANTNKHYKKGVKFGAKGNQEGCIFTRATIAQGRDTIVQTFYLDTEITQVIAFKEN